MRTGVDLALLSLHVGQNTMLGWIHGRGSTQIGVYIQVEKTRALLYPGRLFKKEASQL